ncbi:hypothetical protein [Microbacterium sp. A84]|uniref:hypothetical protein n=1 Tax=Microbacterium sp. A84 TaxID=3450715 RepID=UPI003F42B562
MTRTPIRFAGGTLVVVVAVMLTGCFANPLDALVEKVTEETAQNTAEGIVEAITGGEAGIEIGGLPDDFPEEVPLVSENVLQSVTVAEGMMVIVTDPRSMDELAAQVQEDFAGWEEVVRSDMGDMVSAMYKKDESLSVTVLVMKASEGEETTVGYTVITSNE